MEHDSVIRRVLLVALLLIPPRIAFAQEAAPPTPTVVPAAGRSIKIEGQLQFQVHSSTIDSVPEWEAELRRMRVTLEGDAGDGFSGRLIGEFDSQRARVRDAYVDYRLSPHWAFRAGQFKLPFNQIELASSKRLLVIERGNRVRGLRSSATSDFLLGARYAGRSRGVMATWKATGDRLTLLAGGWLGSGENNEDNDGKELAARVEYSIFELPEKSTKPLMIGAAVATNGFFGSPRDTLRVVGSDSIRVTDPRYGAAFEAFAEYGAYNLPGPHAALAAFTGDNPAALGTDGRDIEFGTFLGITAWAEWLVAFEDRLLSGVGPALRADRFDPDDSADDDALVLLTPGINLYFGSSAKLQVNYDVVTFQNDDVASESALRLQTQLVF